MTLPTALSGGDVGHLSDHDTLHTVYNETLTDLDTRYVTKGGSDSNDGLTWETAFLTVAAAIADLPTRGTGGTLAHNGTIHIGPGSFTESNPLEVNNGISFIGSGVQIPEGGTEPATTILGSNNYHLFAPTGVYTDFSFAVLFDTLRLDGTGIVGAFDLLQLRKGGFNCRVDNVTFRDSPRDGVRFIENAITAMVIGCTWVRITGACVYFECNGGLGDLQIIHSEADDIGSFLFVEHTSAGQGNTVGVFGLKAESDSDGEQFNVIHLKPRTAGGGDPVYMDIQDVVAAQTGPGDGGYAICFEESQAGSASVWALRNLNGQSYQYAFASDKTGQTSQDAGLRFGLFADLASFNYDSPAIELDGVSIDVGDGTPESVVGRPLGSLFLRRDGGASTTLYVKTSDPLVASQGTLTMDTQPTDTNTMTVDTKVYTFQDTLTDVDGNVNIGGSLAQAKLNIVAAFDLSGVAGTDYALSMTAHPSVDMATFISNDSILTAAKKGTAGDSLATTETFTAGTNIFDADILGTTTAGDDGDTGWTAK